VGFGARVARAWYRTGTGACNELARADEAVYAIEEIAPADLVEGTLAYP